jgi:B-cell receptor-associated protein 31
MVIFMGLVMPMPFTIKRKLFTFVSESPLVAKLQYGLKVNTSMRCDPLYTNGRIDYVHLHSDSLRRQRKPRLPSSARSLRCTQEPEVGRPFPTLNCTLLTTISSEVMGGSARSDYQARKFYAQRNMYLCGFTLFLSLILNRTYVMILDTLRLEDEVKRLSGDNSAGGKESAKLAQAGKMNEIGNLKKKLAEKERDIEILKKQGDGFQQEYNRLSDHKLATHVTEPKKDA